MLLLQEQQQHLLEFLKSNTAKSIKLFARVLRNYAKTNTTTVLAVLFSMLKLFKGLKNYLNIVRQM